MAYKGAIPMGSLVKSDLALSNSAAGTALNSVSFADNGGGTGADSSNVAPGGVGSAQVQTNTDVNGLLKVYVRRIEDLPMVRAKVQAEFGPACKAVYLHSNICRSDLLLEIEGAYFNDAK